MNEASDEAIIQILVNSSLPEYNRLCRTSKKMNNFCNNSDISERIFEEKSRNELSPDILSVKPRTLKWQKFYRNALMCKNTTELYELHNYIIHSLALNKDLEAIQLIYDIVKRDPVKTQAVFDMSLFNRAVVENLSTLAIWMIKTFHFVPSIDDLYDGNIIKYCIRHNIFTPNELQQFEDNLLNNIEEEEQITDILDFLLNTIYIHLSPHKCYPHLQS